MRRRFRLLLAAAVLSASSAQAADPTAWLDEAIRYDLGQGVAQDARRAFAGYLHAAQAGLPAAEFNVAAMLDNGRGVAQDAAQAATWYARAAAHDNRRAAFNLGQLYEAGEGVPCNAGLARAWFAASDLPAARARLAALHAGDPERAALSSPTPVAPAASTGPGMGEIELVWTSPPQPERVRFFIELRLVDRFGSREVFSSFADTSSSLAPLPDLRGDYAWRVLAVAPQAGHYATSDWSRFSIAPD